MLKFYGVGIALKATEACAAGTLGSNRPALRNPSLILITRFAHSIVVGDYAA
jgi:hypothetical protein